MENAAQSGTVGQSFKNKFGIYFNNSPDRKIRRERREGKWEGGSGVRRDCGISQNTIELAWLA